MTLLNIVVCHTTTLGFLFDLLVCRIGVAGDDVPGVDETREEAQAAESDVDERVGRAETALDPYCNLLVTDLSRFMSPCVVHAARRSGCTACVEKRGCGRDSPARGGKRMARKPRKISLPHMLFVIGVCLVDVIDGVCARRRMRRGES
jgi:hypothetical protein